MARSSAPPPHSLLPLRTCTRCGSHISIWRRFCPVCHLPQPAAGGACLIVLLLLLGLALLGGLLLGGPPPSPRPAMTPFRGAATFVMPQRPTATILPP